jgi:hypothetical protein
LTIVTGTATTRLLSEGRRELNLDSSVLEEWKRELKKANKGKVGELYQLLSRVLYQAPSIH